MKLTTKTSYTKVGRCAVVKREFATKFCVELLNKSGGGLPIKRFETQKEAVAYAQALTRHIDLANN